jgi:cytochrome o ubiquinol oxidase operon protein cyoD
LSGSHEHAAAHVADAGHADHGSITSYTIGFVLSVILTAIPFGLIMSGAVSASVGVPICVALAVVQIVVHLYYFLHMNAASSRSWNMVAFVFTVVVVAILVSGSLWIMYHLNTNMMPGMMPTD